MKKFANDSVGDPIGPESGAPWDSSGRYLVVRLGELPRMFTWDMFDRRGGT